MLALGHTTKTTYFRHMIDIILGLGDLKTDIVIETQRRYFYDPIIFP